MKNLQPKIPKTVDFISLVWVRLCYLLLMGSIYTICLSLFGGVLMFVFVVFPIGLLDDWLNFLPYGVSGPWISVFDYELYRDDLTVIGAGIGGFCSIFAWPGLWIDGPSHW